MKGNAGGQAPMRHGDREADIAAGSGRGFRATPRKMRYIKGARKGRKYAKKAKRASVGPGGAPLGGDPSRTWIPPTPEGGASRQARRRHKLKLCKALAAENGRRELPKGWWDL